MKTESSLTWVENGGPNCNFRIMWIGTHVFSLLHTLLILSVLITKLFMRKQKAITFMPKLENGGCNFNFRIMWIGTRVFFLLHTLLILSVLITKLFMRKQKAITFMPRL